MAVTLLTVGATVSTISALLLANELAVALPTATVSVASFPAASLIVPPFKESAFVPTQSRSAELCPAAIV